jgi:hypothetical protein
MLKDYGGKVFQGVPQNNIEYCGMENLSREIQFMI